MDPTKERNLRRERNGRNELMEKEERLLWGLRPQTPGIYRVDANPSE